MFDGDRRLRTELSALERKVAAMPPPELLGEHDALDQLGAPPATPDARSELLKTAFKLSRGIVPVVWKAVDRCKEFLGVTHPIDVFVVPSSESNAFVPPPERGRVMMGITSSAIERLNEIARRERILREWGRHDVDGGPRSVAHWRP